MPCADVLDSQVGPDLHAGATSGAEAIGIVWVPCAPSKLL